MSNRAISLIIIAVVVVGAVLLVRESDRNAKREADRTLCESTQGLRGRYLNGIDCWRYGQ